MNTSEELRFLNENTSSVKPSTTAKLYACSRCSKMYKSRNGLQYHENQCKEAVIVDVVQNKDRMLEWYDASKNLVLDNCVQEIPFCSNIPDSYGQFQDAWEECYGYDTDDQESYKLIRTDSQEFTEELVHRWILVFTVAWIILIAGFAMVYQMMVI